MHLLVADDRLQHNHNELSCLAQLTKRNINIVCVHSDWLKKVVREFR